NLGTAGRSAVSLSSLPVGATPVPTRRAPPGTTRRKPIGFHLAETELLSQYDRSGEAKPSAAATGGDGQAHLPGRCRHRHRGAVQGGGGVEALHVPAVREQGRTAGGEPGGARLCLRGETPAGGGRWPPTPRADPA